MMSFFAKKMKWGVCVISGATLMVAGSAASASGITEAIKGGEVSGDFRLRMETVTQDNALNDANALTLRSRLGYRTADYKGLTGFMEFENVTALNDDYEPMPSNPAKTESVVADPEGTEVNQLYLKYVSGGHAITAGRQRVILDNARFVGNVGWRQNEQTFNAIVFTVDSVADTSLVYAYVDGVNTILGGEYDTSAYIFNASYTGFSAGKITGYSYVIEQDDVPSASNSILGLRFSGATDVAEAKIKYTLEYAKQSDYAEGTNIDAQYLLAELGAEFSGVGIKLGYEVLGDGKGANDASFSTPLATKHAFNGWADAFLTTPTDGLQDIYLSVTTQIEGVKLLAVYHDYSADTGSADHGSEINLLAAKKFAGHYTALLKYADYSAGDSGTDTRKLWLMGQMKF
ncbi:MAG: alginate export family protein [Gammaproteobacteria bacterium]|nr:alginate export family protein [Gammaproteobacteria bacterium]